MSTSRHVDSGDGVAKAKPVRWRNVYLHVTKACNLWCRYCYFSASEPLASELTADEYENLWPQLVTMAPRKVVFTGGEPLLRVDLLNLLCGLRAADPGHHILRCVNTNGHLVTEELAERLVGLVDEVRVSLDALPTRNDALRGRGSFAAAMHALDCLYGAGFEPVVSITVTARSLPDLEELIAHLAARRFTRLRFTPLRRVGRGAECGSQRVDPKRVRAALDRAWQQRSPHELSPAEAVTVPSVTCGVGRSVNIMPEGDVFPCHVLTQPEFHCGNVRRQSLPEICAENGVLGRLASLDFRRLAAAHRSLRPLSRPDVCLGDVYSRTHDSSAWSEIVPIPDPSQTLAGVLQDNLSQ